MSFALVEILSKQSSQQLNQALMKSDLAALFMLNFRKKDKCNLYLKILKIIHKRQIANVPICLADLERRRS